ncbi:MAG: hypothetical protein P4K93_00070 [Terracidiphilus sp.]|nr:hypothetical protein [Terracidiphilus sp.]
MAKMGGKRGWGVIVGWGWLMVAQIVSGCPQTAGSNAAAAPRTLNVAAATPETAREPDGQVFRQIEDPSTGDLWLLVRDPNRPAGPGRLVLARQLMKMQRAISSGPVQPLFAAVRPVIHTGDALIVEEHTGVVDARLEAVALEPAVKGAHLKARLKIGGKVVRVVAVSPGHASFAPEGEVAP